MQFRQSTGSSAILPNVQKKLMEWFLQGWIRKANISRHSLGEDCLSTVHDVLVHPLVCQVGVPVHLSETGVRGGG